MIKLSVLIVTYKRDALLLNCLHSLTQMREFFDLEVVVFVNGGKLSSEISSSFKNLTVLENERVTPGVARNTALNHVTGDWVLFLDDDAYLPEDYAKKVSSILEDHPEYECFGGPDAVAANSTSFQESLALVLSSPFCTGPTFKRHWAHEAEAFLASEKDLTSCHLWIKNDLIVKNKLKFAEDFHRGEETVFLQQISDSKILMWAIPSLFVRHERRKSFFELIRPLFYGGYYRSQLTPSVVSIFSLPSIFVLLHGLIFFSLPVFILMGELYFLIISLVSFGICLKHKKLARTAQVCVLHYVIVTLYGVGFLYERIQRLFFKK